MLRYEKIKQESIEEEEAIRIMKDLIA